MEQTKGKLLFEKFRVLQSDTVVAATLYQQTISIFRMDGLCSPPLSAWQARLCRRPRRWTTSYPTRLELQRRGRETRAAPSAGWRREGKSQEKLLTVTFIGRFLGLSVTVIIIFCIPAGENAAFSAVLRRAHQLKHAQKLTRLLAAECSSSHILHSQSLDKTLHRTERKGIWSTETAAVGTQKTTPQPLKRSTSQTRLEVGELT